MADTPIVAAALSDDLANLQSREARYQKGSYPADDTDYHAMKLNFNGRAGFLIHVDNPSDKDVLVNLYGMHTEDGEVGDTGVIQIGTLFTSPAGSAISQSTTDPYPFYLIRCNSAVASATGTTVTIYVNCKEA